MPHGPAPRARGKLGVKRRAGPHQQPVNEKAAFSPSALLQSCRAMRKKQRTKQRGKDCPLKAAEPGTLRARHPQSQAP